MESTIPSGSRKDGNASRKSQNISGSGKGEITNVDILSACRSESAGLDCKYALYGATEIVTRRNAFESQEWPKAAGILVQRCHGSY